MMRLGSERSQDQLGRGADIRGFQFVQPVNDCSDPIPERTGPAVRHKQALKIRSGDWRKKSKSRPLRLRSAKPPANGRISSLGTRGISSTFDLYRPPKLEWICNPFFSAVR